MAVAVTVRSLIVSAVLTGEGGIENAQNARFNNSLLPFDSTTVELIDPFVGPVARNTDKTRLIRASEQDADLRDPFKGSSLREAMARSEHPRRTVTAESLRDPFGATSIKLPRRSKKAQDRALSSLRGLQRVTRRSDGALVGESVTFGDLRDPFARCSKTDTLERGVLSMVGPGA